jgi:hypothetical protein
MDPTITLPRATVQQALEAWEHINKYGFVLADYEGPMEQAITALKAALAQPVQEPVAWCDIEEDGTIHGLRYWSEPGRREHALYTHPPRREWRSLSEEEFGYIYVFSATHEKFACAIEAALRSKNHE